MKYLVLMLLLFSAVVHAGNFAGHNGITLSVDVSRTNCDVPCAVFFDAANTTDNTLDATRCPTLNTFTCLQYTFDFDDSASGTWGDGSTGSAGLGSAPGGGGNTSRNKAIGGPEAAHIYYTAGTYTVKASATDGFNTTGPLAVGTITVNTMPNNNTVICVSPANNFAACPSSADRSTTSDWPTVIGLWASYKWVLLSGGEVFTGAANTVINCNNKRMTSYGTGRAIIQTTSTASNAQIAKIGTATDCALYNLDIDGQHISTTTPVAGFSYNGSANVTNLLFAQIDCHDIGGCFEFPLDLSASVGDGLFIVDSTIRNLVSNHSGATHGVISGNRRTAILGNYFNTVPVSSPVSLSEHFLRIQFQDRFVMSNNKELNNAGGKEYLALRAICTTSVGCTAGGDFSSLGLTGAAAISRASVISDNWFLENQQLNQCVKVGPITNTDPVQWNNVVFERNWCQGANFQNFIFFSAGTSNIIARDNIANYGTINIAFNVNAPATSPSAVPNNIDIINNGVYNSAGSQAFCAAVNGSGTTGSTGIRFMNNACYQPNASPSGFVIQDNGTGTVKAPNSSNAQMKSTIPFVNASGAFTSTTDYKAANYAASGGAAVPVFTDLYLNGLTAILGAANP